MKLVVVESPAKIKSIQKYLGRGFLVKASKGHVVDLPKSELGVDLDKDFSPKYVVTKQAAVQELKKAFQGKDGLIIATDPDREGEAIGWHVAHRLGVITPGGRKKDGQSLERIVFTSITKEAVQKAVQNPRKLDTHLFDAQQARRVLDRLVGYSLSPLLWKKIRFGLSAGRVQSVALRLVVEREEEREAFIPEEYWQVRSIVQLKDSKKAITIDILTQEIRDAIKQKNKETTKQEEEKTAEAQLEVAKNDIVFELSKINGKKAELKKKEEVEPILQAVKKLPWKISNLETSQAKRYPKPPFTTSTLQQTAASWLGFSAKRTMQVAQKLYEQGIITYMRTDSTNLVPEAVEASRKFVLDNLGKEYLPESANFYKTKDKVAQEAHEAIRPTDFNKTPKTFTGDPDYQKLYRLIWQRTVASQMVSAEIEKGKVEIELTLAESGERKVESEKKQKSKSVVFSANGQKMLFPGYLKVYPEKFEEQTLPALKKDQEVYPHKLVASQHFTQPPARYSEASLIKTLESYGIGRPSTYVPTLSTIQTRQYVEKEGKYFFPTPVGRAVTHLLKDHFPEVIDYEFTAGMEDDLDNIANGEKDWVQMMKVFYNPFDKNIKAKDKQIDRNAYTIVGKAPKEIKCPKCKSPMNIKLSKFGTFYSCSKWPDCDGMMGEDGKTEDDREKEMEKLLRSEHFKTTYQEAPKTDDGRDYLLKIGRFGKFWAHPDYPKVKDAKPLELQDAIKKKIYGKPPKGSDGVELLLRRGKFGEFWAHPQYPEVKEVVRINKKEVEEKKKELGVE